MKKHEKTGRKIVRFWGPLLELSWEGLGPLLGGSWASLGPLLAALGSSGALSGTLGATLGRLGRSQKMRKICRSENLGLS